MVLLFGLVVLLILATVGAYSVNKDLGELADRANRLCQSQKEASRWKLNRAMYR